MSRKPPGKVQIGAWLPTELRDRLQDAARRDAVHVSAIVEHAVRRELARRERRERKVQP